MSLTLPYTTRTKSYNNDTYTPMAFWYKDPMCTGSMVQGWTGNPNTGLDHGSIQGVNVSNYFARRRRGELLPITPWYQLVVKGTGNGAFSASKSCSPSAGTQTEEYRPGVNLSGRWRIMDADVPGILDSVMGSYTPQDLIQQAAARIYSSGWDGLTFLGELRQTVAQFSSLARRFHDLTVAERKRADKLKTALEDIRLESRYAWRTLKKDVDDFVKALARIDSKRTRFRETAAWGYTTPPNSWTHFIQDSYGTRTSLITDVCNLRCHGTVVAEISPPKIQMNPFITAWELTRLSFVLDWFIQVGQWLEAMSFLALATDYTSAYGWKLDVYRTQTNQSTTWDNGWSGTRTEDGECHAELTQRIPSQMSYLPPVTLRLDVDKLMDLSSILKKAFYRR